nr:MAG TPA: hypothetical protein [Caudoviricetes sp.]
MSAINIFLFLLFSLFYIILSNNVVFVVFI